MVLSCWCDTHQQRGQGISVSAVDLQQLPTAGIWDQSNCYPFSVLACSPCHGHRSLAVRVLVARSTSASPSPSRVPGRRARAVATAVAVATATGELACLRRRANWQPASSLASALSPSPPLACHHSHRSHSGLLALSSMLQASQLHVAGKQSALLPAAARNVS